MVLTLDKLPRWRCMEAHSVHSVTPRVTDAQRGFLERHSAHSEFSGMFSTSSSVYVSTSRTSVRRVGSDFSVDSAPVSREPPSEFMPITCASWSFFIDVRERVEIVPPAAAAPCFPLPSAAEPSVPASSVDVSKLVLCCGASAGRLPSPLAPSAKARGDAVDSGMSKNFSSAAAWFSTARRMELRMAFTHRNRSSPSSADR
mmetsp:Transcript_4248/g.10448  ORF Transcript_4248/g.10448 Transcript_4248/m.10448 type:complete len:201 (-) Transcript_4248:1435-2037(-)